MKKKDTTVLAEILYDNISELDYVIISQIVKRARKEYGDMINDYMSLEMDLCAVHANCGGLKLKELLNADNFNFCHDITGIVQHLNRETIELEHCFSPRFHL